MRGVCHLLLCAALLLGAAPSALGQARQTAAPEFTIEGATRDVGNIPRGKIFTADYVIRNTGRTPLIIVKVTPDCGCMVADAPKAPILPGRQAVIKVSYNADSMGLFLKRLQVRTNHPPHESFLILRGKVV
jgi:hypothetical protein